jgi:hypothetical protein
MMWSKRAFNHVFVFCNGSLIYKRWCKPNSTEKSQPSMIFNEKWPNVSLVTNPGEGENEDARGEAPTS